MKEQLRVYPVYKYRAKQTWYGDVDLANGHVAVVIEGNVLDDLVLEYAYWRLEVCRLDLEARDASTVVNGCGLGEINGQQTAVVALLHHYRLLRAVLEDRRLIVHARRESVIIAQQRLDRRLLAAHQLELQARVVHVAHYTQNNVSRAHVLGQSDHRQFAVITRIPHCQVEVGRVDQVVLVLVLPVEEANLRGSTDNVIGHHALD